MEALLEDSRPFPEGKRAIQRGPKALTSSFLLELCCIEYICLTPLLRLEGTQRLGSSPELPERVSWLQI